MSIAAARATSRPTQAFGIDLAKDLSFDAAAELWLQEVETPGLSSKTRSNYRIEIKALSRFFSRMPLRKISADDIRAYQALRSSTATPVQVNHEVNKLARILDRADLWDRLKPLGRWSQGRDETRYNPLPTTDPEKTRTQKRASYARTSKKLNRRRHEIRKRSRLRSLALLRSLNDLAESGSKIGADKIARQLIELERQMHEWDAPPSLKRAENLDQLIEKLRSRDFRPLDLASLMRLSHHLREKAKKRNPAKAEYMGGYRANNRAETNATKRMWNAKNAGILQKRRDRDQREQRALRRQFSLQMAKLLVIADRPPIDEKVLHDLAIEVQETSGKIGPGNRRAKALADRIAALRENNISLGNLALLDRARLALTSPAVEQRAPALSLAKRKRGRQKGELLGDTAARITMAAYLMLQGASKGRIATELYPLHGTNSAARNAAKNSIFKPHKESIRQEQIRLAGLPDAIQLAAFKAAKSELSKPLTKRVA
jgi:hypothetical protein